jgi:excisionase family DNA binding protein
MKLASLTFFLAYILLRKARKTESNGGNPMLFVEKDVVLTTQEATKYLRISKPTFLKYIHLGRIKAVKAGNGWRIHKSELHRFLKVGEK